MQVQTLLKNFGLNDKETAVYLALVKAGPSPVRAIGQAAKVNRGTTYDILKSLMLQGLVSYYNRETKQYFVAESPDHLVTALGDRQQELEEVKEQVEQNLPELRLLFERRGGKPMVKFYEGLKGIRQILQDVLDSLATADKKIYYVYSSASLRKDVYEAMPSFSKKRVEQKIKVRTIALEPGGQLVGLDERKYLPVEQAKPKSTYEIIYNGKVAHISIDDAANPVGVLIENQEIYETQKMIFNFNWEKLTPNP